MIQKQLLWIITYIEKIYFYVFEKEDETNLRGVTFNKGSLWTKINNLKDTHNFQNFKTNEGEISIKIINVSTLVFSYKYQDINEVLKTNLDDYVNKDINIIVTWNLEEKELNLYVNADLKQKKKIK
jgi:hypothetical protein